MTGRVTMSDVAEEAGVSLMTVSRVVNDKGEVGPATRQRVLEIIARLGYRPSSIARGLVTQRTGTLGVVVPDIANPFFSDLALGAEDRAYAEGYSIFLCNTKEDPQREVTTLESLAEKRVDGLIDCSSRLGDAPLRCALEHHPHALLVNRRLLDCKVAATVCFDDEAGGRLATEHLLRSGRHAVGYLAGPKASYSGQMRARGYQAALETANVACAEPLIRHCSSDVEGGRETAGDLIAEHPELTALFCYNDLVAVGALQACAALGRRVPEDIAVVGYDDIFLAALVTPALTTCRTPCYELGLRAMDLLLQRIDGRSDGCQDVVLHPELVVRASAP
jgi:LacI family transcriptional regulator